MSDQEGGKGYNLGAYKNPTTGESKGGPASQISRAIQQTERQRKAAVKSGNRELANFYAERKIRQLGTLRKLGQQQGLEVPTVGFTNRVGQGPKNNRRESGGGGRAVGVGNQNTLEGRLSNAQANAPAQVANIGLASRRNQSLGTLGREAARSVNPNGKGGRQALTRERLLAREARAAQNIAGGARQAVAAQAAANRAAIAPAPKKPRKPRKPKGT